MLDWGLHFVSHRHRSDECGVPSLNRREGRFIDCFDRVTPDRVAVSPLRQSQPVPAGPQGIILLVLKRIQSGPLTGAIPIGRIGPPRLRARGFALAAPDGGVLVASARPPARQRWKRQICSSEFDYHSTLSLVPIWGSAISWSAPQLPITLPVP